MSAAASHPEHGAAFRCLGGRTAVIAGGPTRRPPRRVTRSRLQRWHRALTRFQPYSELSLLNAAPVSRVPVEPGADVPLRAEAALEAARRTGGLVDPTLLGDGGEIEAAGYRRTTSTASRSTSGEPRARPPARPARPHPYARWSRVRVDPVARTVSRPVGIRLDSGGVAKGLFADMAGEALAGCPAYVVDCCGDSAWAEPTARARGPGRRPVRARRAARVRAERGRRRHERHRPPQAGPGPTSGRPPPDRSLDRTPGLHGVVQATRDRADRGRGQVPGEGRAADGPAAAPSGSAAAA